MSSQSPPASARSARRPSPQGSAPPAPPAPPPAQPAPPPAPPDPGRTRRFLGGARFHPPLFTMNVHITAGPALGPVPGPGAASRSAQIVYDPAPAPANKKRRGKKPVPADHPDNNPSVDESMDGPPPPLAVVVGGGPSLSGPPTSGPPASGPPGGPPGGPPASTSTSAFDKLNTLKLLLDCGHLTADEYQERKTQIINDMTGTSTERSKPAPRPFLPQPIMKTVVPHPPPDFGRIRAERADKLSFDVDTLEWKSAAARVKIDLVPFATGQLRNAYYLQELPMEGMVTMEPPRLLVAKFSIRHAEPTSYLSDVEMQAVCAHYAALYNEHEPPLKVYYARSWLLKLRDRADLVCSVEEFLPGAYVKYSNNNGYVGRETSTTEERERNTPQAFSHFSFVASDYRLMIVDIQGVDDSYTDPQIHTADGRGFGAGNLGTFGMEKFLESHRCNEVCRWLALRSINEQYKPGGTAAPAYRMPFGGAIKKSTNRITEERNTFSTSVTVSQAFGGPDAVAIRAGSGSHDEDAASSSMSLASDAPTCATGGSSALLYFQQQLAAKQQRYDAHSTSGSGGNPMVAAARSLGLPIKAVGGSASRGRGGSGSSSTWWEMLKRLLCWCYAA